MAPRPIWASAFGGGFGGFGVGAFGAAGASTYANTAIGQVVTLAYIDAYSKLVTQMGGLSANAKGDAPAQAVTLARAGVMRATPAEKGKVLKPLDAGTILYPDRRQQGRRVGGSGRRSRQQGLGVSAFHRQLQAVALHKSEKSPALKAGLFLLKRSALSRTALPRVFVTPTSFSKHLDQSVSLGASAPHLVQVAGSVGTFAGRHAFAAHQSAEL